MFSFYLLKQLTKFVFLSPLTDTILLVKVAKPNIYKVCNFVSGSGSDCHPAHSPTIVTAATRQVSSDIFVFTYIYTIKICDVM